MATTVTIPFGSISTNYAPVAITPSRCGLSIDNRTDQTIIMELDYNLSDSTTPVNEVAVRTMSVLQINTTALALRIKSAVAVSSGDVIINSWS